VQIFIVPCFVFYEFFCDLLGLSGEATYEVMSSRVCQGIQSMTQMEGLGLRHPCGISRGRWAWRRQGLDRG